MKGNQYYFNFSVSNLQGVYKICFCHCKSLTTTQVVVIHFYFRYIPLYCFVIHIENVKQCIVKTVMHFPHWVRNPIKLGKADPSP
jgi:hypothetical protein